MPGYGVNFVIWAPRLRYYTQIDAPGSLDQLADTLETRFNLELPLVDLPGHHSIFACGIDFTIGETGPRVNLAGTGFHVSSSDGIGSGQPGRDAEPDERAEECGT